MTIRDNLVLSNLREVSRMGFLRRRGCGPGRRRAAALDDQVRRPRQHVASLSGGNQQKVLLGRVLACSPSLLLMFDATRGVDIGTKSEIYALMRAECNDGVGIIFYSSDVAELVNMADRVIVLHDGAVYRHLQAPMTEESVVAAVVGAVVPRPRAVVTERTAEEPWFPERPAVSRLSRPSLATLMPYIYVAVLAIAIWLSSPP